MVGLVAYLLAVANIAQNYRQAPLLVQGGWLGLRMSGIVVVVAGAVLLSRILHGRRHGEQEAARTTAGEWTLACGIGGSVVLLLALAYWGVFSPLW